MLWADPNQRSRLVDIRDNLIDRISEPEREGWLGEVEGLRVSLAGAQADLAQIDRRPKHATPVTLGPTRITLPSRKGGPLPWVAKASHMGSAPLVP